MLAGGGWASPVWWLWLVGNGGKNEEKMAGDGFYFGLMDFVVVVEHGFCYWV
jgi:hypothetical protein